MPRIGPQLWVVPFDFDDCRAQFVHPAPHLFSHFANIEINGPLIELKLKSKEENLAFTTRQLEETKASNFKLTQTLKDYEKQLDSQRNEISGLNNLKLAKK